MTEDADDPEEPRRSGGADGSASDEADVESSPTDAETDGAGEGGADLAEEECAPAAAGDEPQTDASTDRDAGGSATSDDTDGDADGGADGDGGAAGGGDDSFVVEGRTPSADDDSTADGSTAEESAPDGSTPDGARPDDTDGAAGDDADTVGAGVDDPDADGTDDVDADDTDDAADTPGETGTDPAADGTVAPSTDASAVQESRVEAVAPPDQQVSEASAVDAEEETAAAEASEAGEVAEVTEAGEAAEATPDEDLTAAQKGMQTVENVGNALGGGVEGPATDEEMPLTEHIEEMMRRLSAVFAVAAVVSGMVLFVGSVSPAVPSAAELIRYFWDYHVGLPSAPGATDGYSPYVYGPLEYLLTKLKVVGLAGLLAGLPVFVYQTYRFMRPGLYPHERRYYLAAVPTSLVLGVVGAAFAHFAVLPFVFDYFISYTVGTAELAFGLKETFNLILIMMGYFAVVFQIPLFIQLAIMMGVVTRQWLEDRRLLFWGGFLGLALTFISVDPTGFAPIIVVVTMIVLFEGTLALLRWTGN